MRDERPGRLEDRVLLLAPTAKDAVAAGDVFSSAGFACFVCKDLDEVCAEIERGAGVAVVPEEAVLNDHVGCLARVRKDQPAWSDFPLVVLTPHREGSPKTAQALESLGPMTLVRRPVEVRALASTIRAALRDRRRQYAVRDHLREREQLLEVAEEARAEAEAANRMKDEFLATLSHELRTPLNAMLGWSRILRAGDVDEEDLRAGLDAIERNSTIQAQIIEDLLDVSRIISGNLRLDVQRVNLPEAIDAALAAVAPAANAKGLRVQKLLDSLAGPVSGDAARLQQVVWNLLSNAVKFTPRGGKVQVLLERVNSHVELSVVDTGQGIRPDFLPHVFDRFRQADATSTRRHGGLGLGLSIVKQLVEVHGGTVRAQSPGEGQGSTFTVTLPIAVVHPDAAPELARSQDPQADHSVCKDGVLEGVRVLVVDDEPDARHLIRRILSECRADVSSASSAEDALRLLEGFRPHVLLSDIGMPDQDGYDLIRLVRGRLSSKELPAAALTAFARSEDRKRALRAGFQTHVTKPVDPSELVAVVASLAGRTGGA